MRVAVVLLAVFAVVGLLFGDVIFLDDGRIVRGKIVEQNEDYVKIKTKYGTRKISVDRVREVITEAEMEKRLQERMDAAGDDADALWDVVRWCRDIGLDEKAKDLAKRVLELNPDHESARKYLGYIKKDGAWVKEEQWYRAHGWVRRGGRWVSPEELKRRELEKRRKEQKAIEQSREAEAERRREYEGVPWGKRHIINTAHFVIECNSTREVAERYAKIMEIIFENYCKEFAAFRPRRRRCRILIFRNYQEFLRMTHRPPGVGGFYMPGRYQLVTYHGVMGTGDTTLILLHEGTHLFQDLIGMFGNPARSRSPMWIIEGMAVLHEGAELSVKRRRVRIRGVNRDRLVLLQNLIEKKKNLSLRQLITTPKPRFRGVHYAHAGLFVYYLLKRSSKHRKLLFDYIRIATGGRTIQALPDLERLASRILHKSLESIEKDWLKWVMRLKPERFYKVRGRRYVSEKLRFEVEKPRGWGSVSVRKLDAREALAFTKTSLKARIYIIAASNMMGYDLKRFMGLWKNAISRAHSQNKVQNFKVVSQKETTVAGLAAMEVIYDCKVPESKISKDLNRRARIFVAGTDFIYMLTVMAPPGEKFEQAYKDFKEWIKTFKILPPKE
ncbi:MAG: hypothetical protein DRP63_05060 [Planctomycetota bacterium]|nr:MAG: hypothetical protein DRP63_05060 [Planctomycetota bacterium]